MQSLFSPVVDYGFQKRCKGVYFVDLGESVPSFQIDPNSNAYLLAKFGFDTASDPASNISVFIYQFLSMSLFLNLLFETDSYSNEYLLAKCCFDTAENEP